MKKSADSGAVSASEATAAGMRRTETAGPSSSLRPVPTCHEVTGAACGSGTGSAKEAGGADGGSGSFSKS